MRSVLNLAAILTVSGFCIPAVASAQTAPAPATARAPAPADANEIVCEKQRKMGTRLVTRRVCLTRAQWAELRREDRSMVEQAQAQRGMKGE
jgi:invasion protein IalB